MKKKTASLLALIAALSCGGALAQTRTEHDVNRDVNQQERIEQGLKSGKLSTQEAGRLEREQQVINRIEAKDMKDGKMSAGEQQKLNRAKNRASQDIYSQKHDAQMGNPNSTSSRRMQADVGRNVTQQKRIQQGLDSGHLTNREAAMAESGQAHNARREANSAKGGVTAAEQARVQAGENRSSRGVYRKKHNRRNQ
jgi:hypothetical protein